jgi:hypothetical protein
MRLLTRTGRETADGIKDALDIQTNGGQKMSLENSAYLNMETLGNPETKHRMLAGRSLNYKAMSENAAEAMGASGVDVGSTSKAMQEGFASGGYGYIAQQESAAQKKFANDPVALQSAIAALRNFSKAGLRMQVAGDAAGQGGMDGGLGMAVSEQTMGDDSQSQTMKVLQAVMGGMQKSGHSTGDIMSVKGRSALVQDPMFQQYLQQFGVDANGAQRGLDFLPGIADAKLNMAQTGMLASDKTELTPGEYEDKQKQIEEMYKAAKDAKVDGLDVKNPDHAAALRDFANDKDKKGAEKLTPVLLKMQGTFEDFYNSPYLRKAMQGKVTEADKNAAMADTAKLVANTRPTADIFADAFTYLFNLLAGPLNIISRVLSFKFKDAAAESEATGDQKKALQALIDSGDVGAMFDQRQKKVDDLQTKYDKGGQTDQEIKRQLDQAKTDQSTAQATANAAQTGRPVGAEDVAKLVADSTGAKQRGEDKDPDALKYILQSTAMTGQINTNSFDKFHNRLTSMKYDGGPGTADPNGPKDTSGANITINQNSVDMGNQNYAVQTALAYARLAHAAEHAPSTGSVTPKGKN